MMAQTSPEQYFGAIFFGIEPKQATYKSLTELNIEESLKCMVNNFIVLDYEYSRIFSAKWEGRSRSEWRMNALECVGLMFYGEFLKYYRRYCDGSFEIPDHIDKGIYAKKMKSVWNFFLFDNVRKVLRQCAKVLKIKLHFLKRIMCTVLPGYRVGVGIRERLLAFEQSEGDRFNYLIYRIELLDRAQKKNLKEIRMLKKRIAHLEDKELGVQTNA